ncbi:hypothetical protein EYB53_010630 [Candidatus Chloroploca sp. M-50]|uniref:Uncharacterized protein n=1 Tax=Candidatus Chloroploca mongolica TaxID=2528176 RepID=A0ABS4D9R8_9CHLR|nr:hypothetical protein [Candidatus Chloroploca mongolica]MBP1466160.1 hypothetical protein [Candidatus Chloroploca mongolica]
MKASSMNDPNRAAQFHQALLTTYQEALKIGYRPTRFLQLLNERGGVETARLILNQLISLMVSA